MSSHPSMLVVLREVRGSATAAENFHVRRILEYLRRQHDLRTVTLMAGGLQDRLRNLLRGLPPEATAYYTSENRERLRQALVPAPEYVYLIHESLFPFDRDIEQGPWLRIHYEMNPISMLSSSDPDWQVRAMTFWGRWYERNYYGARGAWLVAISEQDADWLQRDGRRPVVSAVGALPPKGLRADAGVLAEFVLTGTYDWWRKVRDLQHFAARAPKLPLIEIGRAHV